MDNYIVQEDEESAKSGETQTRLGPMQGAHH